MRYTLLIAVVLLAAACQRPARTIPATFDSPRDVEFIRWCVDLNSGAVRAYCEGDACGCTDGSDGTAVEDDVAYALVANAGGRMVHRVRVDTSNPTALDLDQSVPGVTGVAVPDGPIDILPLSHPTLVATISERSPALSVADLVGGELASLRYDGGDGFVQVHGNTLPLSSPVTLVRGVHRDSGTTLVLVEAIDRRARVLHASSTCDGSATRAEPGCSASVDLIELPELALPGSPTDLAIADSGRVFVTVRDDRRIFVGALFGDDLQEHCGGSPCLFATMGVGASCQDGIDNDDDGLVDADDPQCFSSEGDETGLLLVDETPTECSNGLDDDGDGAVDADDTDCRGAADRVEGPGYDGVTQLTVVPGPAPAPCEGSGEGSGEGDLLFIPSLEGTALPEGVSFESPRCSNGLDDDGDGDVDWPDDSDCYGPYADSEVAPVGATLVNVILSDEQDYLYSLDRRGQQLYVHDAERLELIPANEFDPTHTTLGVFVGAEFLGPIVAETTETVAELAEARSADADGDGEATVTHVRRVDRNVHVATTSGFAETIRIDTTWTGYDGDPTESDLEPIVGPDTTHLLEPIDLDGGRSVVERVTCTDESPLESGAPAVGNCTEEWLPQPRLLDDPCGSGDDRPEGAPVWPAEGSYWEIAGDHFATLVTTRSEWGLGGDTDECNRPETRALVGSSVNHDFAITDGEWSAVYQGTLNGTARNDGLRMPTASTTQCPANADTDAGDCRGWVEFAGQDPCALQTEDGSTGGFCSWQGSLFDAADCPELAELCSEHSSAQICEQDIDVCGICPGACRSAVDFCGAGVLPNDILVIERQELTSEDPACADFARVERGAEASAVRLEYVICAVTEAYLEIATFDVGCDGQPIVSPVDTIDRLPPTECYGEPLETSVRASDWLVRIGSRTTGLSPYRAVDGRCVLRADAEERLTRLALDHEFTSPLGLAFTLDSPVEPECVDVDGTGVQLFPRDFTIDYDVDRNFRFRGVNDRQLLLGPASAGVAVGDTDRGPRVMFVDESQSFLWVHSGTTYREIAPPIP